MEVTAIGEMAKKQKESLGKVAQPSVDDAFTRNFFSCLFGFLLPPFPLHSVLMPDRTNFPSSTSSFDDFFLANFLLLLRPTHFFNLRFPHTTAKAAAANSINLKGEKWSLSPPPPPLPHSPANQIELRRRQTARFYLHSLKMGFIELYVCGQTSHKRDFLHASSASLFP